MGAIVSVRSVIDIDLNDAKFVAFKKLYDQYQAALAKAPAQWALVNAAMSKTETIGRRQLTVMQQITAATSKMSLALESVARSLLKVSTITGVVGGLVGVGSLFGIERLAAGAAAARRSALGIGSTYGQQQGFQTAFGRFTSPDFLESVASARFDVNQRVGLLGAGLTPGQMAGDTAQVGTSLLRNLKRIADNTDPGMFQQVINARRLGQFTSTRELELLRNTRPEEFEQQMKDRETYARNLRIDDSTLKKWQDLTTYLEYAGKMIDKTFIVGLVPLAEPLRHLSGAMVDVVSSFLDAAKKKHWIEDLGDALERFSKYVGTPEFDKGVRQFVDDLGQLTTGVGDAVKWFKSWFKMDDKTTANSDQIKLRPKPLLDLGPLGTIDPSVSRNSAIARLLGFGDSSNGVMGTPLTTIRTASGQQVTVAADQAANFAGFLSTLEAAGAPITSIGGYNPRKIAGTDIWSEHAFGRAIDIDQSGRDKVTAEFRAWVNSHKDFLRKTESQYGIVGGENFAKPDLGHFEASGGNAHRNYTTSGRTTITIDHPVGDGTPIAVNALKN